jgi:nucleotide-binding universal stress UspA family protein
MKIKRIVAPVDFSPSSEKAVDYAIELARALGAEIILVHVIEPLNYAVPRWLPEPTALLEEQRKEAAQEIARLEKRVLQRRVGCRSEIHFGVVYEMIAEAAANLRADLVVIATHGRTGLSHMIIGSVAERVIQRAPCPVLTVRTAAPPVRLARPRRAGRARPRG